MRRLATAGVALAVALAAMRANAQHVSPDPPQQAMVPMVGRQMAAMMEMDDTKPLGAVVIDQLEWSRAEEGDAAVWDAEAWYGGDYDKAWLKSEGSRVAGTTSRASVELLWDRIVSRWWNVQAGARQDFGGGPGRTWAAVGVEGMAPYGIATEATVYVGQDWHAAVRFKAEYNQYLTQRLILQPKIEGNVYTSADAPRKVGSGLSDLEIGARLRYEVFREFAPYVGVNWEKLFGRTATYAQGADDLQFVAGFRVWF